MYQRKNTVFVYRKCIHKPPSIHIQAILMAESCYLLIKLLKLHGAFSIFIFYHDTLSLIFISLLFSLGLIYLYFVLSKLILLFIHYFSFITFIPFCLSVSLLFTKNCSFFLEEKFKSFAFYPFFFIVVPIECYVFSFIFLTVLSVLTDKQ